MLPFPEPTAAVDDRREVLLGYLDHFRSVVVDRLASLGEEGARTALVPSGWTPVELAHHLCHVERRWIDWGFLGAEVDDPWGEEKAGRWHVTPEVSVVEVARALVERGRETRAVALRHDLAGGSTGE